MKKKEKKTGFVTVMEACKVCGIEAFSIKWLTDELLKKLSKCKKGAMPVVGYLPTPCDKCHELLSKGFVIIGVIDELTNDISNPYRSGDIWVVTKEYFMRLSGNDHDTLKQGYCYMDIKVLKKLKFPMPEDKLLWN